MKFPRGRTNGLIAIFLTAGLVLAIGLIAIGGKGSSPSADAPTTSTTVATTEDSASGSSVAPGATLPLDDLSAAALTELTGLVFPAEMTEFLTSKMDDNEQLDITFVMPATATAGFLTASGLPAPVADKRLVTHSSPLWKVNPEAGTTLSGTQDDYAQVHRVVELLGEDTGTFRARIVITPN